ncbi:hypothetical protein CY35_06G115900 [Sphagnum magellanicum]|nr:hypothetical protein CY35_06G115900 [Sphagnum magellanicum]
MRWSPAARRGRVAPATASRASAAAKRSFVAWNCFLKTRRVYRSSTLSHNEEETDEEGNGDGVLHDGKQQLVQVLEAQEAEEEALTETQRRHGSWLWFKSKTLEWNQERGYWCLDFKGLQLPANLKLGFKFLGGGWRESC